MDLVSCWLRLKTNLSDLSLAGHSRLPTLVYDSRATNLSDLSLAGISRLPTLVFSRATNNALLAYDFSVWKVITLLAS